VTCRTKTRTLSLCNRTSHSSYSQGVQHVEKEEQIYMLCITLMDQTIFMMYKQLNKNEHGTIKYKYGNQP
jgi:hypothetical protein